tara:strand:+ start:339 stop:698 length:360 start_codon:yes stop_codon:yes gene_type:complete
MNHTITKLKYTLSSGSLTNVVNEVHSEFVYNVVSSSVSASVTTNTILAGDSYDIRTNLNPVASGSFISYDSLTEDNVKSWVQDSFGNGWGEYTSSIENNLSASVSLMLSPPTTEEGTPW